MFKQRLLKVVKKIGYWIGMCLLVWGCLGLFIWAAVSWRWLELTMYGVFFTLMGGICLFAIIGILLKVWQFIRWLFVEPYKNWRSQKDTSC